MTTMEQDLAALFRAQAKSVHPGPADRELVVVDELADRRQDRRFRGALGAAAALLLVVVGVAWLTSRGGSGATGAPVSWRTPQASLDADALRDRGRHGWEVHGRRRSGGRPLRPGRAEPDARVDLARAWHRDAADPLLRLGRARLVGQGDSDLRRRSSERGLGDLQWWGEREGPVLPLGPRRVRPRRRRPEVGGRLDVESHPDRQHAPVRVPRRPANDRAPAPAAAG